MKKDAYVRTQRKPDNRFRGNDETGRRLMRETMRQDTGDSNPIGRILRVRLDAVD
jgi:hypothetical protein